MTNCPYVGTDIILKQRFGKTHHVHQKNEEDNGFPAQKIGWEKEDEKKYLLRSMLKDNLPNDGTGEEIICKLLANRIINDTLGEFISVMNKKNEDAGKLAIERLFSDLKDIPEYTIVYNKQRLKIFLQRRNVSEELLDEMSSNVEVTGILNTLTDDDDRKQNGLKAHERLISIYKKTKGKNKSTQNICSCQ